MYCEECGCDLMPWEYLYSRDADGITEYICEDCFDSLFLELSRTQRAKLIGSEVMLTEDRARKR